ncbi:UNVERIFIED_CONTAM: hypothetical protein HDU68_006060 [Siphonaria sp. JEL0065]|nr:hypothetical protein HDU68_006060 [Siphonaria sp. JEL0065]
MQEIHVSATFKIDDYGDVVDSALYPFQFGRGLITLVGFRFTVVYTDMGNILQVDWCGPYDCTFVEASCSRDSTISVSMDMAANTGNMTGTYQREGVFFTGSSFLKQKTVGLNFQVGSIGTKS